MLDHSGPTVFTPGMRIRVAVIAIAVAALSCAGGRGDVHEARRAKDGPAAVLAHIIDMANRDRLEEVSSSIVYTLVADFDENLRARGTDDWTRDGKRAFWKLLTREQSVREVLPGDERISGAFALVHCRLVYRDGDVMEIQAELKRGVAGNWVLIVYPAMLRR